VTRIEAYFVQELRDDAEAAAGSPHAEVEVVLVAVLNNNGAVIAITATKNNIIKAC